MYEYVSLTRVNLFVTLICNLSDECLTHLTFVRFLQQPGTEKNFSSPTSFSSSKDDTTHVVKASLI